MLPSGRFLILFSKNLKVIGALLNQISEFNKFRIEFVNFKPLFPPSVAINITYYDTSDH